MNKTILFGTAALAAVAGSVAWTTWGAVDPYLYRDAAAVSEGQALYAEHCASCHGATLTGEPDWKAPGADGYMPAPPHDESGHTWHHADELLFRITKFGSEAVIGGDYKSRMEGFGDRMSDGEIRKVLAFIKSTWPPRVIERHDQMNAQSQ